MFKSKKRFGVLGAVAVAGVLLAACHSGDSVNGVGSDTTSRVMTALTSSYNGKPPANGDQAFNTPAALADGQAFSVEGDSHCGAITYNASNPPPNGSSAGITTLVNDTQSCVDFARSSRDRRPSDPSSIDFFAFAKDGVSYARYSGQGACPTGANNPNGCVPSNLSQSQLQGIYLCDQPGGLPRFTNYSQVGGDNAPIIRYLPQTGSGTLSFFETKILGLTSVQQGVLDDSACSTTKPIRIQENTGTEVPMANRPQAILPYSYADYTAQANGVVADVRGGAVLGSINGVAPSAASIGNNTFLGTRYVYNVVKSFASSTVRAINFVGVTASGNGFICQDNASTQGIISQYGFVPLSLAPAASGLPVSRCRRNPTPI